MPLTTHAPLLHGVAERLGVEPILAAARRPGVGGVYRVTRHYFDRRARDVVATLSRRTGGAANREAEPYQVLLEIVVDQTYGGKPLVYTLDVARYDDFARALQGVGFDKLDDQPGLPVYDTTDLWLIERGSGTFAHGVIVAPEGAADAYARLINAVRNGLPEIERVA